MRTQNLKIKIKPSSYSRNYSEACDVWRGPSPRLSTWATHLRKNRQNVAAMATREKRRSGGDPVTVPEIKPKTSRAHVLDN